ncbi:MAG: hypothetical protein R3F42_03840 [Pseudomonadota bacterium]
MRLLELRGNEDAEAARHPGPLHETDRKPEPDAPVLKRSVSGKLSPKNPRVFPIKPGSTDKPLRRRALDLEHLQRRIEELERRIQERARAQAQQTAAPANDELEQLRQRMKLLERRIEGELWSARQREHTLLELLAKPTLTLRMKQQFARFLATAPASSGRWLQTAWQDWWKHSQPLWWPRFAAAWQEALHRAMR